MHIAHRFEVIDHLLAATRAYWQFVPFECDDFPWETRNSALTGFLSALPEERLENTTPNHWHDALSPLIPELAGLPNAIAVPMLEGTPLSTPFWLSAGIKGRKLKQIEAFAPLANGSKNYLEWCAGKGHLGRLLGLNQSARIESVEIQSQLCEQGLALAQRHRVDQHFHCQDVLNDPLTHLLHSDTDVIALHACGELHRKLISTASEQGVRALLLSPCCYQKTQALTYKPLSKAANNSSIVLRRSDLQLAVQETVTAGQRERQQRDKEQRYRLAFDLLQRQIRGAKDYLAVPSARQTAITRDLPTFCQWAAEQKRIPLDGDKVDWDRLSQQAQQRQLTIKRMSLVQHQFRRALELWLVFDMCLHLQDQGYEIEVGEFCPKELTPRNLAIRAVKEM